MGLGVKANAQESLSGFFSLPSNLSATQSTPKAIIKVLRNLPSLAIHRHPTVFTSSLEGEEILKSRLLQRHKPLTNCTTLLETIVFGGQQVTAVLKGVKCRLEGRRRGVLISLAAGLVGMRLPARLDQRHSGKGDLGQKGQQKVLGLGLSWPLFT